MHKVMQQEIPVCWFRSVNYRNTGGDYCQRDSKCPTTIRGTSGEVFPLYNLSTSDQLFSIIEARTGVPSSVIQLFCGRKALQPNQSLKSTGVEDGCMIEISVRGTGGGKGIGCVCLSSITIT